MHVHSHSHAIITCAQVAIERKQSLFIDDPLAIPGLEKNEDWVKFGYGYYVGAPWVVGQTKGECVDYVLKGAGAPRAARMIRLSGLQRHTLCC